MCPSTPPKPSSPIILLLPSPSLLSHTIPGVSGKEMMLSQQVSDVQEPVVLLEGTDLTTSPTQSIRQDFQPVPIGTSRRGHTMPPAPAVTPSIVLTYSADDSFYLKRLARKSRRSRLASFPQTPPKKTCLPSTLASPLIGPSDVEHDQYGGSQIRIVPTTKGIHRSSSSPSRYPPPLKTIMSPNASTPPFRRLLHPQSLGIALRLPILILVLHLYFFLTGTGTTRQGHDLTFATPLASQVDYAFGLRSHNQAWSRFGEAVNFARYSGSDVQAESSIWSMQHSDDDDDDD